MVRRKNTSAEDDAEQLRIAQALDARTEENARIREEARKKEAWLRANQILDSALNEHRFRGKSLFECLRPLSRDYGVAVAKAAVKRIEEHKDELSAKDFADLETFKQSLEQS